MDLAFEFEDNRRLAWGCKLFHSFFWWILLSIPRTQGERLSPQPVSILVLVDLAFESHFLTQAIGKSCRFNPCISGSSVRILEETDELDGVPYV